MTIQSDDHDGHDDTIPADGRIVESCRCRLRG
eukprot:CAMPEP_0117083574 /NCGR_PEP_ID=MMETSP0472-20121206/58844_1 /TAXON_ID=693140 ORGANISM="Tiarina fusus, Strain LIS" /NCGR_SAMPLE_ID=MMETSP0472 /ASSEMBLY_ACC=CAM_ASM_000603 /LENGTH=31 /DNA_ID= /DNA_START= /DNA_END= /DNA_ORIENTATION=